MKLREILAKYVPAVELDSVEHEILYNCEDVTYLDEDSTIDPEDDGPPLAPTVENVEAAVSALPADERAEVLRLLRESKKKS